MAMFKGISLVDCIDDAHALVGESPVWSRAEQVLWWVDIAGRRLHRFDPVSGSTCWETPCRTGAVAVRKIGGLILAAEDGFAFFDGHCFTASGIGDLRPEGARYNDGVVSPEGRFLVTTMQVEPPHDSPQHQVVALSPNGHTNTFAPGLRVGNGLAFSPDGGTLFLSDTHQLVNRIWAFDWCHDEGVATNRRVFYVGGQVAGYPDGAAVDADGCYWFAAVGGWQLVRLTPAGAIDRIVGVPVEKPSKIAFGGRDLRTMFVTSIGIGLTPGTEVRQPQAGGLFALDAGVCGLPADLFAG